MIRAGRRIAILLLLAGSFWARAADERVAVSVWAIQATTEEREGTYFDAGLEAVRAAVSDLPFNTYRKLSVAEKTAGVAEETAFSLSEQYTLFVTPLAVEGGGDIRLELRVELNAGGKTSNAVQTTVSLAPGKQIKFTGLKMKEGELVVVLSAVPSGQ